MEQPGVDHIVEISSPSPDAIFQQPDIEIMPQQEVLTASTFNLENSPTIGNGSPPIASSVNYRWHLRLQLVLIAIQVLAAVPVLLLTKLERPTTFLRDSIIVYAISCLAALPLVFLGVDQTRGQAADLFNFCIQRNIQFEAFLYFFMEDNPQRTDNSESLRIKQMLMMCLRMILNLVFGFWLVTAGIKILKESSPSSAPILYSLNVVYFSYGCLVHVLALIVFPVLTCARAVQKQGCSSATINSLQVHIFTTGGNDGGVVSQGSDNERVISENEAVCAICLAAYDNNDELRELPCSHLLHKDCVDRWLRIKARCPLCSRVVSRRARIKM